MSKYTEAVDRRLKGLSLVPMGLHPGCQKCADLFDYDDIAALNKAIDAGDAIDGGGFSWVSLRAGCDVCGDPTAGIKYVWHAMDEKGEVVHGNYCCMHCVAYLANGKEPENWEG